MSIDNTKEREHYLKERMVLFSKRIENNEQIKLDVSSIHKQLSNLLEEFKNKLTQ